MISCCIESRVASRPLNQCDMSPKWLRYASVAPESGPRWHAIGRSDENDSHEHRHRRRAGNRHLCRGDPRCRDPGTALPGRQDGRPGLDPVLGRAGTAQHPHRSQLRSAGRALPRRRRGRDLRVQGVRAPRVGGRRVLVLLRPSRRGAGDRVRRRSVRRQRIGWGPTGGGPRRCRAADRGLRDKRSRPARVRSGAARPCGSARTPARGRVYRRSAVGPNSQPSALRTTRGTSNRPGGQLAGSSPSPAGRRSPTCRASSATQVETCAGRPS
jgi:hypothetical protein